jgi:hypothetical protein
MFPSPHRLVLRRHSDSVRVAESCVGSCYSVFIYFLYLSHTEIEDSTDVDDQEKGADYA